MIFTAPNGCISPITGGTAAYKFNSDEISGYFNRDIKDDFQDIYQTVCVFGNRKQIFAFTMKADRDTFYTSLP